MVRRLVGALACVGVLSGLLVLVASALPASAQSEPCVGGGSGGAMSELVTDFEPKQRMRVVVGPGATASGTMVVTNHGVGSLFRNPPVVVTVGFLTSPSVPKNESRTVTGSYTNPSNYPVTLDLVHSLASVLPQEWTTVVTITVSGGDFCPGGSGLGSRGSDGAAGDPVSTSSGNFHRSVTDVEFPAGLGAFTRTLNTMDTWNLGLNVDPVVRSASGPSVFGRGWSSPLDARSVRVPGAGAGSDLMMRLPDGRQYLAVDGVFDGGSLSWTPPAELLLASVTRNEDAAGAGDRAYTWTFVSGEVWTFDRDGRLLGISDPYGADVVVERAASGFRPA